MTANQAIEGSAEQHRCSVPSSFRSSAPPHCRPHGRPLDRGHSLQADCWHKWHNNVIRSVVHGLLITSVAMGPVLTSADEGRKLPAIGLAVPIDSATDVPYQTAFRNGLRDFGYVDGKNVSLIVRYANGDRSKLSANIRELIALRVDILVTDAPVGVEATTTIPIVSPTMSDPVRTGLVASLARPGGNLTGLSAQSYDIWPKQLELARELVPNLRRVCFLFDTSEEPHALTYANEFSALARSAGVNVRTLPVGSLDELRSALRTAHKERPQMLMIWTSPLMVQRRRTIIDSVAYQLPMISDARLIGETGALLTCIKAPESILVRADEIVR